MEFPKLKNRLILAPMAEVTNYDFRLLCKKYGAGLTFTEMISANALSRNNVSSLKLIKTSKKEGPVGIQLFGQNPETILKAAKKVEKDFDIIDLNLGCPVKRIMGEGAGAALLKRKNRIKEILDLLVANCNKPITVKIRSGITKNKTNAVEIAKLCEKCGVAAISIHARTVAQGYAGKANWDLIKKVKEAVSIPVIGNGDVIDGKSAEEMLKIADYCMIGRAAQDNPAIFKQILTYFKTGKDIELSPKEKINLFFEYECDEIKYLRSTAQCLTKGLKGSAKLRDELSHTKTKKDINDLLENYMKEL